MNQALAVVSVLASYALGSVSFALLAGRIQGVDLRGKGSGNPGATNAGRVLGRSVGGVVLLLDVLKGFLPTWIGTVAFPEAAGLLLGCAPVGLLMGLAAVLGHCYPAFHGLRGGKGVATTAGVVLAISWPVFVAAVAAFALAVLATRIVSVASMIAGVVIPVAYLATYRREALEQPGLAYVTGLLFLAILVLVRHRENIHRIVEGQEPRIGRKAS